MDAEPGQGVTPNSGTGCPRVPTIRQPALDSLDAVSRSPGSRYQGFVGKPTVLILRCRLFLSLRKSKTVITRKLEVEKRRGRMHWKGETVTFPNQPSFDL